MQGSIAIRNEVRAMAEHPPIEFLYVIQQDNKVEAVTTDLTLYFQTAYVYPFKALAGDVLTANANNVTVGKSGVANCNPTSVIVRGNVATVTKAAHTLRSGMSVNGSGFTPAGYNVLTAPIFNVTANTFDFQLPADPGPVTALGVFTRTAFLPDTLVPTDLAIKYALPLGIKMRVADLIVRGTATDGVLIQAW